MTEPCPRCPPFVVRCGHLGEADGSQASWLRIHEKPHETQITLYQVVWGLPGGGLWLGVHHATRAEADAEFERREEALLA